MKKAYFESTLKRSVWEKMALRFYYFRKFKKLNFSLLTPDCFLKIGPSFVLFTKSKNKILSLILLGELSGKGSVFLGISHQGMTAPPSTRCLHRRLAHFLLWETRILLIIVTLGGPLHTWSTRYLMLRIVPQKDPSAVTWGNGMGF